MDAAPHRVQRPPVAEIGKRAVLEILREQPFGVFLDGGELGEVLLPRREMPPKWQIGGLVDVFLYNDSEDRPVATLKHPLAMPGEFARLRVIASTAVGAFLDWGLPKDLLVPFREQKTRMEVGKSYIVHLHVDQETGRIVASTRLSRYLDQSPPPWKPGDPVDLMAYGKTELGYKAIIANTHSGLLFADQVFQEIRPGERLKGFVAGIRPDGKIDLRLQPPGRGRVDDLEAAILREIEARGGFWAIGDHTPAAEVRSELGVSKRTFKQATGALLRKRKITISEKGLRLADGG